MKLNDNDRQAHAVIYTTNATPDADDDKWTSQPSIAVNPSSKSFSLNKKSRLDLRKILSIERNVPVLEKGDIVAEHFALLRTAVNEIFTKSLVTTIRTSC
jgi:hypothetical protein